MDKNKNSNKTDALKEFANSPALKAVSQYANSPRYQGMMQSILPDMSVLDSISETMSVLSPIFDTIQGIIDSMTPLWESGCIHSVNPEAVWTCMENEDTFKEEISDEVVDVKAFTADVTELIQSDNPDEAVKKFQNNEMSSNEVEFSVFCVENVAAKLGMSGDKAYQLLTKDKDILDEYIIPNYEMLHTQDKDYIVSDIIDYMKECGVLK